MMSLSLLIWLPALSEAGLNQHLYWGILLAVLLLISRGAWSVDAWLEKRLLESARLASGQELTSDSVNGKVPTQCVLDCPISDVTRIQRLT